MNKQIHIIYKYDSNKKHTNKKFTSFQFELFQGGLHIYYSTQTVCIFETYIYDMWNEIGYLLIRRLHIQYTHIYRYIWLYLCFEVRLLRWWYVCDVDFVQVEYANNQNILKAHDYQYKIYFTWIPNGFSTLRRVNHLWKLSIISYSFSFIGTTQRAVEYSK